MADRARKPADLVLSGGGVKGVGLVGAVAALIDAGYLPRRVSGTSVGSIVGAIVAATSMRNDVSAEQVKEIALGINYRKFLDPGRVEAVPLLGPAVAMLSGNGIYRGDYAHGWIRSELKSLGVKTFGDLALDDETLPEERRYKLVVTAADLTRGELVRLPWDYRRVYGLDPDEQPVAHAVRASMSIPFFFRPVKLVSAKRVTSMLVDGGLISNFPIDSLERTDGKKPRWPTFGVTVMPENPAESDALTRALARLRIGAPPLLERVIMTALFGRDESFCEQPSVKARTIEIRTPGLGLLEFNATSTEIDDFYAKSYAAAQDFLSHWDWQAYLRQFHS